MISKELLSEVLKTVKEVTSVNTYGRDIVWSGISIEGGLAHGSINIHELTHKVKELAFDKYNAEIKSYKYSSNYWASHTTLFNDEDQCTFVPRRFEPSEPEAVFKSGQWLLDNKKIVSGTKENK